MNFGEKDVKKLTVIGLVVLLIVLIFLLLKPVILSILGGLILAYAFMPFYKKINSYIKNKTVAASIASISIIVIVLAALWFMIPVLMQQVFDIFTYSQKLDVQNFFKSIFPTATDQYIVQLSVSVNNLISKGSSLALNSLLNVFLELPKILLNLFIICFVFFFALRDSEQLKAFFKGLSPFTEAKEKVIISHFKSMTDSVIYGQVLVGIVQGALAGIGFFIFGIDKAIALTLVAIFFSIIPFIGPAIIWIPVSIYLFSTGNTGVALGYLAYNLFIVSIADNILRSYIISRKTDLSPAVVLVGMLGGLFVFGILGLIVGPLLLAYLITLLESFKDKSFYSLFSGK